MNNLIIDAKQQKNFFVFKVIKTIKTNFITYRNKSNKIFSKKNYNVLNKNYTRTKNLINRKLIELLKIFLFENTKYFVV